MFRSVKQFSKLIFQNLYGEIKQGVRQYLKKIYIFVISRKTSIYQCTKNTYINKHSELIYLFIQKTNKFLQVRLKNIA